MMLAPVSDLVIESHFTVCGEKLIFLGGDSPEAKVNIGKKWNGSGPKQPISHITTCKCFY